MKFNNGILDPASIKDSAMETDDLFLQDLYEIAINSQMVEMYLDSKNTYLLNGIPHSETFSAPYDDNDDVHDVPYGTSKLGGDSDASSSGPNTDMDLCNRMHATRLANIPNNKENASIPNLVPRTNRKLLVYKYIQVR